MRTRLWAAALFCGLSLSQSSPTYSQTSPAVYGQHFPQGWNAVSYIYGPSGMWREQTNLFYGWNYYDGCASASHPANKPALIAMGAASNVTAPDADCLILGDINENSDIADDQPTGFAFHEHSGRGTHGNQLAAPFYQFWFDDNWLARYMASAYGREPPSGLHDNGARIRWRLLGGDNRYWTPRGDGRQPSEIALNGIYRINAGDFNGALADWRGIKGLSKSTYDIGNQRYDYPSIVETYHLGLWLILSERLLAARADFPGRNDVLQHAISMRSDLLSLQERSASGERLGWKSGISDPRTLINTETVAVSVLALGTNANWVLEPGYPPLTLPPGNYFVRPYGALSAVTGLSTPGFMVAGPSWTLAPGTYAVDFTLRTPANNVNAALATVEIYDGAAILASALIPSRSMPANNEWVRYRLITAVTNPGNRTEFRVYWHGNASLDVGSIRVTKDSRPSNVLRTGKGSQIGFPAPYTRRPRRH